MTAWLAAWVVWLGAAEAAPDGELVPLEPAGDNPGGLDGYLYAPPGEGSRPLVVALHGCYQGADDLHQHSGWSEVADQLGFVVLYPEQRQLNNMGWCFNWHLPGDHLRDQGESGSIVQLVASARQVEDIDEQRVVVAGVSAGAWLATALAANHPDLFTGLVLNAGGPFGCADSLVDAWSCMAGSVDHTPQEWLELLLTTNGFTEATDQQWPRAVVWQGAADPSVHPSNQQEVAEQWTRLHGADPVADHTHGVGTTEVSTFDGAEGEPVVWTFLTQGMGHGIQVDPDEGCGEAADGYFADVGLCTAWESALLLGLGPSDEGDTGAPPDEPQDTAGESGGRSGLPVERDDESRGCATSGATTCGVLLPLLATARRRRV